jgi:asparagine synthetase A
VTQPAGNLSRYEVTLERGLYRALAALRGEQDRRRALAGEFVSQSS